MKNPLVPAPSCGATVTTRIKSKFTPQQMLGAGAALLLLILSSGTAHASFDWVNFDSDIHGPAINTDTNLINPWGLVSGPFNTLWVADNGAGVLTRYEETSGLPLTNGSSFIPIPPSLQNIVDNGTNAISAPTGIAPNQDAIEAALYNTPTPGGFTNPSTGTPAWFLIASEDGAISVYTPGLSGHGKNQTTVVTGSATNVIDNSTAVYDTNFPIGAVYKGIALATSSSNAPQLYAANFRSGNVEVYDTNYQFVKSFTDTNATNAGYAPFNVKRIDVMGANHTVTQLLFVTFALQDSNKHDDVSGPGHGLIDVFDTDGTLKFHFATSGGDLNSPWGMEYAPSVFGKIRDSNNHLVLIKDALLVGNFGDGKIHAFDMSSLLNKIATASNQPATELGALTDFLGRPLQFDGLWTLQFGRDGDTGKSHGADADFAREDKHDLFFSAGIVGENDGLMGRINFLNASH